MAAKRTPNRRSFFSGLKAEFNVARLTWLTNVRSALELRAAFVTQIIGMMLNDCSFVFIWLLFFHVMGTVNGWSGSQTLALLGFNVLAFGLTFGFAGGSLWLPRYVEKGTFDGFLLSPRNLYIRTVTSRFDLPALGDASLGLILIAIFVVQTHSWLAPLWFLAMLPAAIMIFLSFSVTIGTASFFLPDANHTVMSLFKVFLNPTMYHSALFPKAIRFFFIIVIPSITAAGLPVETVMNHSWLTLGLVWLIALLWLGLSIAAFYGSVRHYESGNYIGLRG